MQRSTRGGPGEGPESPQGLRRQGNQGQDWRRTLSILFFAQLATAVGFSSIFPFLPLYVKSLGSSMGLSIELLAGLVFSAQALTMMLASPVWGSLADRYGRKLMSVRASFGGAVLLLMMAYVRTGEQLVLLRAIQGLITGTVAANSALLAAQVPRERMGYAMGMLQVGLGAGLAVGPMLGGALADAYGYASAFYVTSVMLALAGLVVLVWVHEDAESLQPRASGERFFSIWRRLLTQRGVSIGYLLRFLSQLGRMMVVPVAPLFVEMLAGDAGGVNSYTGLVIGGASAATTVSSILLGRLGDRLGYRKVAAASALMAGLLYIPQTFVSEVWQLLLLSVFVGAAMGGVIPTISALLASYSGGGEEGSVYGLDNAIRAAARTVAPMVGSWVMLGVGLRATFSVTGALFLLCALIAQAALPAAGKPAKVPPPAPYTRNW